MHQPRTERQPGWRAKALLAVGAVVALCLSLVAGSGSPVTASSHREAPLTAADPQIDATDLYAFVSPDDPDTVTLISNWIPFEESAGGPNFYLWGENVHYDINIDNDGDAKPDLTYRWTFTTTVKNGDTFLYNTGPVNDLGDDTLNIVQHYTLERIAEGGAVTTVVSRGASAPSFVGDPSMPDYAALRQQAVIEFETREGLSFAGQADDPFFLDLRIFDLLYGGDLSEVGKDSLASFNVNVLALQVQKSDLAAGGDADANPIVGVWTTAERPSLRVQSAAGAIEPSGDFVQVSRLGNPLVNEVVVPVAVKDAFNASKPEGDGAFLAKVQDPEVPKLIEAIYDIEAPATPRDDLVSVFLTGVDGLTKPADVTPSEQLRLNMSIAPADNPNRLGVIGEDQGGFPNGRRLVDDVVDIGLQVLMGELTGSANDLGDGVNANDAQFEDEFPYVALPHSGSETGRGGDDTGKATEEKPDREATARDDDDDGSDLLIGVLIGAGAGLAVGVGAAAVRRRRSSS